MGLKIRVGDVVQLKDFYPDSGYSTDDLFTVRRVGGHVLVLKHVESGEPVYTTFDDVQKVVPSISGEELKVTTVSTGQIEIVDVSKLHRAIDFLQVGWGESDIERVLKLAKELV